MDPFLILQGDCCDILPKMRADHIHCVITSPPYFGLRDYQHPDQIGLELDPETYVERMVQVFRELHRVLRTDGTAWLNLGDCYAGAGRGGNPTEETSGLQGGQASQRASMVSRTRAQTYGQLKPKNLMGIPWRVALALQTDGWYLRQDIIWHKPNPMPESVTDRCTKAHEYIFFLTKSERYYFDADAIKEPANYPNGPNSPQSIKSPYGQGFTRRARSSGNKTHKFTAQYEASESEEHRTKAGLLKISEKVYETRNKRSVWTVASKPFREAHFATFPPDLIRPCVLAGCPRNGVVLDPFAGAGTTGLVATREGRGAVLIEVNPEYCAMADRRLREPS